MPSRSELRLPEEHILHLSEEARTLAREAEIWIESQLSEFGELGGIQDWAGKWFGAVCRIAGLLHMVEHADDPAPWNIPISASTMTNAISIGRYLIPHAKAAYALMGADPEVEDAKYVLRWLKHHGLQSFSKRQAFEGTKGRFKKVGAMEPAFHLLIEHGYIRQRPAPERPGPGRRPSPVYEVNSYLHSQISLDSPKPDPGENFANCANSANQEINPGEPSAAAPHEDDRERVVL